MKLKCLISVFALLASTSIFAAEARDAGKPKVVNAVRGQWLVKPQEGKRTGESREQHPTIPWKVEKFAAEGVDGLRIEVGSGEEPYYYFRRTEVLVNGGVKFKSRHVPVVNNEANQELEKIHALLVGLVLSELLQQRGEGALKTLDLSKVGRDVITVDLENTRKS